MASRVIVVAGAGKIAGAEERSGGMIQMDQDTGAEILYDATKRTAIYHRGGTQ
jgi:hypothetical protein